MLATPSNNCGNGSLLARIASGSVTLGSYTASASQFVTSSASSGGTMRAENNAMLAASGENRLFS